MLGYFVLLMAVGVTYPDVRSDCGPHQALEDTTCVQCPTCPVGTGLSKTCGYGHGGYQRCLPCPEGSYHSDVADSMCVPCADCAWYRRAVKYRCRTVINAECGQCLPGYFDDETDARDRSILTRCTTCSAMPNAPECREISVPLAKVTETTSNMETPRADTRGHGDAILALQILSMVFCLCVCLYVGYKYIQSKRPGAGKCLHVNFWCKGSRLAEEGEVGGTEVILDGRGGHHEMENFSNHRREGGEMTGSEEEALIDSRTGGDTTRAHGEDRDPVASTSQGNCSPKNGQLKRLFEREDWPNSKHGDGNEYSQTSCIKEGCSEKMECPKPHVDQIEKRDHVHNYIPGKSGEQIEKPPAVVQSSHQTAAPTIDDVLMNPTNRELQEAFIDLSKSQIDHDPTRDLPPIILPEGPDGSGLKHVSKKLADSMEDDPDLMRVFGLQATRNYEEQIHSRNTPQSSSEVQTSSSTASSVSMISTGYPSQGSTLLIRDISIDNHLGSEHGGSEISIQGSDRGMSILTASDNLSLGEQRGHKMSLRAPDSFRQKDTVKEPPRPLRRCSTLPQLFRGPFTDISNIANENCSCKISSPSMPWERVRSNMRVPDEENRVKPEQSVKNGNRENQRQTFGGTQNNIDGEVRNVNGNTTTTNNNNNNSRAGGHNLNIHINNNFMPPQLTGTDTTIDLRSLFETGNLTLHDLNLGNCSRENQVGEPPDTPSVHQPGAVIKRSPSQTRPKEVSPLLPRGCGMASRKDTALPVQETVKS